MIGWILGLGLAAFYITYVVTQSDFPPAEQLRAAVYRRWSQQSWQGYLVMCGWCVSAYASAVVVGGAAAFSDVPLPVVVWLAVAAVSGWLAMLANIAINKELLQRLEMKAKSG